jgi:hypothetical protein
MAPAARVARSRLDATTEILARCGARPAPIYGRMTDAELYRALLDGRHELFVNLAEELAASLRREAIELVAGHASISTRTSTPRSLVPVLREIGRRPGSSLAPR